MILIERIITEDGKYIKTTQFFSLEETKLVWHFALYVLMCTDFLP